MQYQIDVIGTLYSGHLGSYTYIEKELPGTLTGIKRLAGDFAIIKDYRITSEVQDFIELSRHVTQAVVTTTVLRDWADPAHSEDIFLNMNEAA